MIHLMNLEKLMKSLMEIMKESFEIVLPEEDDVKIVLLKITNQF